MKRILFWGLMLLCCAGWGGCSSSDDDGGLPLIATEGQSASVSLETLIEDQGLRVVDVVTIDGHTGYLAEYDGKFSEGAHCDEPDLRVQEPKQCLFLTGSPYALGYQVGALMPEETRAMLVDFPRREGLGQLKLLGIKLDSDSAEGERVFARLREVIDGYSRKIEPFLPLALVQEMQGVADGVNDVLGTDLDMLDVLRLNQGVDSTYFFLGALLNKVPRWEETPSAHVAAWGAVLGILAEAGVRTVPDSAMVNASLARLLRFGCNEFVVGGELTRGGETFHGRDFMFGNGRVYQDACCVMVYLPEDGQAFAAVDAPGFVGHSTGLNARGVSVGMDVCQGAAFGKYPGMGCLLVARQVLQQAGTLQGAVDIVDAAPRGVPWIYVIGDDDPDPRYGCGVELETVRCDAFDPGLGAAFDGVNGLPLWEQMLLDAYISRLDGELPANGIMARGAGWRFPEAFVGMDMQFGYPPDLNGLDLKIYFPEQIEDNVDLLAAANHNIIPRMRFPQLDPVVHLIYGSGPLADSIWRYRTLVGYLDDRENPLQFFGEDPDRPQAGSAGWVIDFLNTGHDHPWYYRESDGQGGYAHALDRDVEGHHVIMNNSSLEVRALFGYMTDPWVGIRLAPFAAWQQEHFDR